MDAAAGGGLGTHRRTRRDRGDPAILTVHNTLTRRKEPFEPLEPGRVRLYVCGPNLHGPAHVGHGFSYAFFDVVRRYLEYKGYRVRHVQNFTDIEDHIIERSLAEGRPIFDIAEEYIERFFRETDALGIRRAHATPRASEVIPTIIRIIGGLLASGHAYAVDGDVYFRVTSFPSYLRLSGRSLDEMQAGARIEPDPRKEHPMDFALWKAAKPGEPSWPSPWGAGRPGWHIECSAMNMQDLGEQIDVHGGGEDVIFPHHENEIAQSESYTGRQPFVRYWLHNALMKPASGEEKMTRSLGNFVSLADALARYEPDAIRLFYLSAHYRTPLRWVEEAVQAAGRGLERLRVALANAEDAIARTADQEDAGLTSAAAAARSAFEAAMDDDFNTPQALAALYLLAAEINKVADAVVKGAQHGRTGLWLAADTLRELAKVLGLSLARPGLREGILPGLRGLLEDARREAPALFTGGAEDDADGVIAVLLAGRQRAREARAFALSDRVRARLGELGIIVEDLPGGARWRPAGSVAEAAKAGGAHGSPPPS